MSLNDILSALIEAAERECESLADLIACLEPPQYDDDREAQYDYDREAQLEYQKQIDDTQAAITAARAYIAAEAQP